MQLSVSTGKYGILQRATFLTFGDSQDHTTQYPLADMVASANRWVQRVALKIWRASDTWEFDDSNQTTLPSATTTMVDGQNDYSLPTNVFAIQRVEVKLIDGTWKRLTQLDMSEVGSSIGSFQSTKGIPVYYDVKANSIFLYPAPDATQVTLTNGLKIFVDREALTFNVPASYTTDDTTEPGFAEQLHDIICYGIAHDYLEATDQPRAASYFQKILLMEQDIPALYGNRNRDKRARIVPSALRNQGDYR